MKPDAYLIEAGATIRDGLDVLNRLAISKTAFVIDDQGRLLGTFTDGDARRALLLGVQLNDPIAPHINKSFRCIKETGFSPDIIENFRQEGVQLLPLLNKQGVISRLYDLTAGHAVLPLDAVIMAGGRGKRLAPLTDSTPKPLLPVGNKPIIEHNVDRMIRYGIDRITISVRYLGDQLEAYFGDGTSKEVQIEYVKEDAPRGTMGSLSMLSEIRYDSLLVMNSDLLTNINYLDMYTSFLELKADLMVASIPYKVDIPYAILETDASQIRSFSEKPSYTYFSNAGIYLMRKELVERIPKDKPYDATDLMQEVIQSGGVVAHFPILGYWLDIGKPDDYKKANEDILHLNL